ncbi:MAG: FkbM family methyltransferase [Planctomycetota bacterium]|nr:FkbM family methyltransferase [Planctomycetota bacterium]
MNDHLAQLDARLNQVHGGLLQVWRQFLGVRRTVARLDALDRLARAGQTPHLALDFKSQFGEDITSWELLGKPLSGFFIEVGAFDGVSYSTTYALEAMGWTGLLVEPTPARAEACRANRPHSRVVHSALAGPTAPAEATFHVLEDEYGGMLSYAEGLSQGHHVEQVHAANVRKVSVRVPVTTLDRLLEGHNRPIDLVTIDVEGAELELLAGFDLARWRPRLMLIEDSTFGNNPALDALVARGSYQVVGWVESSRVYARSDEADIIRRAREVL